MTQQQKQQLKEKTAIGYMGFVSLKLATGVSENNGQKTPGIIFFSCYLATGCKPYSYDHASGSCVAPSTQTQQTSQVSTQGTGRFYGISPDVSIGILKNVSRRASKLI
jgi:hypothetical protein